MPNSFFWHELITSDPKSAEIFYRDVVGWTTQDSGVAGFQYTIFNTADRGVAGMMAITAEMAEHGARPAWLGYIAVDDVDQMAARIKQEGGAVHREPMDVPGVIRLAVVADPQGSVFYVAKGLVPDAPPPLAMGTPGTVGWNELMAVGLDKPLSPSTKSYSAGPRPTPSTRARWAPISCSRRAARQSAP